MPCPWAALCACSSYHTRLPPPCCLAAVQLAVIPGAKGMQELLHHIPTWISFRDTEKMEVRRAARTAAGMGAVNCRLSPLAIRAGGGGSQPVLRSVA